MLDLKSHIRTVTDFPKPGVNFFDITTLLAQPEIFRYIIDSMEAKIKPWRPNKIATIDARGFLLAGALAYRLGAGLIPIRKAGKLPHKTITTSYQLEYGQDSLEMHTDAINSHEKIVIVDDLIATGGSLKAACDLIERLDGQVVGICCIIALNFLPFRERLTNYPIEYLISYDD